MTVEIIDMGAHVECDACGVKFTTKEGVILRHDEGGILFEPPDPPAPFHVPTRDGIAFVSIAGAWAICPACTPRWEETTLRFNENHYITERAKPGERFATFALRVRRDNTVRVYDDPAMADIYRKRRDGEL